MKLKKDFVVIIINLIGIIIVNAQGHLVSGTVVDMDGVPLTRCNCFGKRFI